MSGYIVEGWDGIRCLKVRSVVRPATAVREAQHQAIDLGASTVWVRRADGAAAYTFDGMFWQMHAGDDGLAALFAEEAE